MIIRRAVVARASEDAARGIYQPDSYIIASQGPEPSFDPVANLEHAGVGSHLQDPTIAELQEDIRRDEDELAHHPSARLLLIFLVVLLFLETAGTIYVMNTIGLANPERIIFGSALAVCLFFTAWLASRTANRLLSIGAIAALGILIAALSVVRVDDNAVEGDSKAVGLATAVIMTAVTVGPALMAEHILRLLAPALPLMRRVRQMRRRIKRATSLRLGANRFVTHLAKHRHEWQKEASRRRAIYDVAHRAARAELERQERSVESSPAREVETRSLSQSSNQPIGQ
ncbi:MAG TPA: hypothetical protein VGQ76_03295 [Thermoanaerobaculia bacterium]|jgi:hypothetical protein|nr:hypothetical protein [Thermoanaerobaculia bacterium]